MAVIKTQYVVYVGEDIKAITLSLGEAQEEYDNLPSGKSKPPSKKRSLVKEEILIQDT